MEKFFSRRGKFIVHRGCIKHAFPAVPSTGLTARRPDIIYSVSLDPNTRISRVSGGDVVRVGDSLPLCLSLSRWEGGKQSSDETVYLDGCATHGGAPGPDVNLAVSLIDAAPETLLREEKFPKELGGNERDLSPSTL